MAEQNVVFNNGQQAIINTSTPQIFLWNKRSEQGQMNNGTYDPITYPAGTVLGRVSATGLLKPLASAAVDGSQFPVGVLMSGYTVEEGETRDVFMCVAGDVAAEQLIFQGSDTLNTVISGRRLRDRIQADTVGIKLVFATEMSGPYDNQ